jgi:hypothetical protein
MFTSCSSETTELLAVNWHGAPTNQNSVGRADPPAFAALPLENSTARLLRRPEMKIGEASEMKLAEISNLKC